MSTTGGAAVPLPRVRVLLAVHNGAAHLQALLDSVLAQQGVTLSIECADDASHDASVALLDAHARHDARLRRRPGPTPGGSAAANFLHLLRTTDLSQIDYVALCDQDDLWLPGRLQRAVDLLRRSGADLYSAATEAFWPDGRRRILRQVSHPRLADFLFEGAGQGCSFVLTGDLARQLQPLLVRHAEQLAPLHYHDWALYAAVRALGRRWIFDPQPALRYRQHAGNDTGARNSGSGVRRRLAALRSGWYRRQTDAMAAWVAAIDPGLPALRLWSSAHGRMAKTAFLLRHGRRRWSDRLVLVLAVWLRWL